MNSTINETVFYHIYPLGLCNCPRHNDFHQPAGDGLRRLADELHNIKNQGFNAIYIGPLFESSAHGYDTVDYFWVDRRLGTNLDLIEFVQRAHELNIKVVLDAVFNHTGRDFFAFKDLQQNLWNSNYKDWYQNVDLNNRSPYGDNFSYNNWAGCNDLVKLNLDNPEVQKHIFQAVKKWITEFKIDGLRLDAADVMSPDFMKKLRTKCLELNSDFWLMGEVVHGDYNNWANDQMLHSVTNYQLHKGMWSSFKDHNFFEVAYSLKQMFADGGKFNGKMLYNFLDNHDVNRVANSIDDQNQLVPLYALLFTVPGIPSIYYGSQYGIRGERNDNGDYQLRPAMEPFSKLPEFAYPKTDSNHLLEKIKQFSKIRKENQALMKGNYREIFVSNNCFGFLREFYGSKTLVILNCDSKMQEFVNKKGPQGNYKSLLDGQNYWLQEESRIMIKPYEVLILSN